MTALEYFTECTRGPWISEQDVQYKYVNRVLYFQCSDGLEDWKRNFNFPAVPYKDMDKKFLVHKGFLEAYKIIRDEISEFEPLAIVGYSHGAALAILAAEDFSFRGKVIPTIVFGCPRVFFNPPDIVKTRTANVIRFTSEGDIVSKVPPLFSHVGREIKLKTKTFRTVDSILVYLSRHSPSVYRQRLAVLSNQL